MNHWVLCNFTSHILQSPKSLSQFLNVFKASWRVKLWFPFLIKILIELQFKISISFIGVKGAVVAMIPSFNSYVLTLVKDEDKE